MILYGRDISLLSRGNVVQEPCPRCGATHKLQMQVYCLYSHLYFVSVRPKRKVGALSCLQCGVSWYEGQLPYPSLEEPVYRLRTQTRYKFWNYIGLVIFGIPALLFLFLILSIAFTNNTKKNDNDVVVSKLQPTDVVYVKLNNRKYTTWFISRVSGDTIFIFENKVSTNLRSQLDVINDPGNYRPEETWFYKSEMEDFISKQKVFDVDSMTRYFKSLNLDQQ